MSWGKVAVLVAVCGSLGMGAIGALKFVMGDDGGEESVVAKPHRTANGGGEMSLVKGDGMALRSASEVESRFAAALMIWHRYEAERQLADWEELGGLMDTQKLTDGLGMPLSPRELQLIEKPLGEWSEGDLAEGAYSMEVLRSLWWAIGGKEFVKAEELGIDDRLAIVKMKEYYSEYEFELRDAGELKKGVKIAEYWGDRYRLGLEMEGEVDGQAKGAVRKKIHEVVKSAGASGEVPVKKGDFVLHGKPIDEVGDEARMEAMMLLFTRLRTLYWLTGESEEWDGAMAKALSG